MAGGLTQENDDCRGAHRSVLAGEGEVARNPIDAESGDDVASLIARVEEIPCWIDVEAARISASSPNFSGPRQATRLANGKNNNAVVQPVGSVNEPPARRDLYLRSETGAGEALG